MAMDKFRFPPLPSPPKKWDAQYGRQLIRVLENYFSQLDSNTPNHAEKYTANAFVGVPTVSPGGNTKPSTVTVDDIVANNSIDTNFLTSHSSLTGYERAHGVWTDAIINYGANMGIIVGDSISANNFYGGTFYGDGRFLQLPYNQLSSDQDQTAASVANAYAITLNTDEFPDGISIVSNSQITFAKEGIYNIAYSIQFTNTDNSSHDIDIWLRKNGADIANSNSRFSIPARKSSGDPSHLIAVTPIMVDITADGQYIEIMWRVSNTAVSIEHYAAVTASPGVTPAIPATPSVIVGVTHVSAQFPPVTRVAPLPVFGFGEIGTISVSIR